MPRRFVRFGVFEVDLTNGELRKLGTRLRIQEQPFHVLAALLEQPGEIVTREELIRRLWADGTVVDYDRGLNAAVTRLRQVLSDSADAPRFVETVAKRGYRLIIPVEPVTASPELAERPAPPTPRFRWPIWAGLATVLLGAPLAWRSLEPKRTESPPAAGTFTVVPVTSDPGNELAATISPDGTQIAYQWDENGPRFHVFLRQIGIGDPVRLTKATEAEYCPSWSPDGHHIALLRQLERDRLALVLTPVLGGGMERKLMEIASPDVRRFEFGTTFDGNCMAWTPNGKFLFLSLERKRGGFTGLLRISTETGEQRWIHEPPERHEDGQTLDPTVSPDGRTLAFVRTKDHYVREVFLHRLTAASDPDGPPIQLTSLGRTLMSPAWTGDGRAIIFGSALPDSIWRVEAMPGSIPERLQGSEGQLLRRPIAGPKNTLLLTRRIEDSDIWAVQVASGKTSRLIQSTQSEFSAEYSPDGSRIVLRSQRSGTPQIWVCQADGSRCVQLTQLPGYQTGSPRWSPDGNAIAFDSNEEKGNFDIFTVPASGGTPARLTNGKASETSPAWSHDGRWVYFSSSQTGRSETWKIPAGGGTPVQVTRNGSAFAVEAPGGDALYYYRERSLYRSQPDGSGETKLVERIALRSFAVTRDRIYYFRIGAGRESELRTLALAGGQDSLITKIPKIIWNGLSVSPDGRTAIFAPADIHGTDIVMVENVQ